MPKICPRCAPSHISSHVPSHISPTSRPYLGDISQERVLESMLDCPPCQSRLLWASDGDALQRVHNLCQPAHVALQEHPPMLVLSAPAQQLQVACAKATAWLREHAECRKSVDVPADALPVIKACTCSLTCNVLHLILIPSIRLQS